MWGLGDEPGMHSGAPVWIIRSGFGNPKELMDEVGHEGFVEWLLYQRLLAMHRLDALATESGKLVKMVTVNDFRGVSLFGSREPRLFKALGELSEMAEYLCPQAVMRTVMLNTPTYASVLFRFAKPFMPKKALAKVGVCPADTLQGQVSTCPFMRENWGADCCPDFLGGKVKLPEGHPLFMKQTQPIEGFVELVIKPETSHLIELELPVGGPNGGGADVEWSILCLPHGFALNPGVTVSAWLMAIDDMTPEASAAMMSSMKTDPDSEDPPEKELEVAKALQTSVPCTPDGGKCDAVWRAVWQGPAMLTVAVHNPSRMRSKTVRYALRALD
mmetsp:Transcript_98032/g.218600  ORF Transcript_98032/g.218600 Transcript_98032/m.218600 type:complete len:330 (-) Transcript_98032:314-1303(-)